MFKAIYLFVTLLAFVIPSLIGHKLSIDNAGMMFFLRDKVVIILLTGFVIKTTEMCGWTKAIFMMMLVVCLLYIFSFIADVERKESSLFNYVIEKEDGE